MRLNPPIHPLAAAGLVAGFAIFLTGCAGTQQRTGSGADSAPASAAASAQPVPGQNQNQDPNKEAKRKFLEAYEKALLRSPAYNDQSRAEAVELMRKHLDQPPFDDIDRFLTPARAEQVRHLRIEQGYTYRALAAACAESWGANWGSNQLVGEDLWRAATKMLGLPFP